MREQTLLSPGPTPVPERARLKMAESLIHHRGPEFEDVFRRVRRGLRWIFETDQQVLTLTCSGTGAFEAGMANFLEPGDTVVAIGGGKFGQRWGDVARARDLDVVDVEVGWGAALAPSRLADVLDEHPEASMVTLTASETSTAVLHPVEELAQTVRARSSALFAVDGITAVGVHPVKMDEWDIDILVAGAQKAFGIPPGLGFVAASDRAWERHTEETVQGYYFDLERERNRQSDNQTAFTPGISQILALDEVLKMMREEGVPEIFERHAVNARAVRRAVESLGLELLADRPSNAVTAVKTPEDPPAGAVVDTMREAHGAVIAGGQKHLAGEIFRLGHIGFFDRSDIVDMISALELSLDELGYPIGEGRAVETAQSVYRDARSGRV